MFGRIYKKTIFFVLCAIPYCLTFWSQSIAYCLPLIVFFFQFQKPQRFERLFSVLNVAVYIILCIMYVKCAFHLWADPENLLICASVLIHTSLASATSDVDFEDHGFLSILYIIGIFVLPLIARLIIESITSSMFLTILRVLFVISGIGTIAAPVLLIKALFETSAFDSGVNRGEGGCFKVESAAKRAARYVTGVRVVDVSRGGNGYIVKIGVGYDGDVAAELFAQELERQGVDMSVITIRY